LKICGLQEEGHCLQVRKNRMNQKSDKPEAKMFQKGFDDIEL
jgi:hypothetical protein